MLEIRRLDAGQVRAHLSALARVLVECVEAGASVSFMLPYSQESAEQFFSSVAEEVGKGNRLLLAAFVAGTLVGTVQMVTSMPPNQPHRVDISKLLVSTSARRQGVGRALMQSVEEEAGRLGKTLGVLDTAAGGDADRMYERLGWHRIGVIPRYAKYPDGRWGDTAFFFKEFATQPANDSEKSIPLGNAESAGA